VYQTWHDIPYFSAASSESIAVQSGYLELARIIPNFFVIGPLAESKYYHMDAMIERALCLADEIIAGQLGETRF
jgi:UDP-galactopyranose mutase